jgi:hypothetical protein
LLVFANKQDLPGALTAEEIKDVKFVCSSLNILYVLLVFNLETLRYINKIFKNIKYYYFNQGSLNVLDETES